MRKNNILKDVIYYGNIALAAYLSVIAFMLTQKWVNDDIAFRVNNYWWLAEAVKRFGTLAAYGLTIAIVIFVLNKALFYWVAKKDSTKLALQIGLIYFCGIAFASAVGSIFFFIDKPYF